MNDKMDLHNSEVINASGINNDFDKADEVDHTFPGDDLLDPAHVDIEVPKSKLHKMPNEPSQQIFGMDEKGMELEKSEMDHLLDTEGRQDIEGYYEDDVANQFNEEEFFDADDDGFLAEDDETGDEPNDMEYDTQELLNSSGLAQGGDQGDASLSKKNREKSRKKASVVWLFYKAHSRTHIECTVCHAHLNRSDGHSTKGMWSHLKKHPEKLTELKIGLPLSIDKNNPSPKKRSSLGSASRKNKALATGNDSYDDYLLPTNSKSVSNPHLSPNPATQMDVDEENNDGEGEQQIDNDGNPSTNASSASLRRGGRQRKKNPRFEEEDLIGITSNRSSSHSSSSRTQFGPPLAVYIQESTSEERMMEDENIPKSYNEKVQVQKWAPSLPARAPDSLLAANAKTTKSKSQNVTSTYSVKQPNLPNNVSISTSPAMPVQQQKRIPVPTAPTTPAQQQHIIASMITDQNDSHHQKGSITVGQLLRAHREQSDRIDVLLSENEKLTNALAESRRQNEVLIRQNADIVKRLQEGNFFNGSAGDQRLLGNHQRAVSNSLTATNTAAVILRERSNGANSAAAENAKQKQQQQRQQSQPPQAIKRKLRESPATDKVAAVHPTMGRSSVGREIRAVVQEPPSQRRRGSINTPLAIEVEKQRQKQHIMAPLAPFQPIATTEAEKARELAALKESLKELQFTDGMANLIGDRRPKPYTPKEFGDWHSTTSTELRKAQSAELYRSICASSTTGNRTSAENLDFAFHLENEAFNEATSRIDYFERLAKRQLGFRESVSSLKFTGELPPSDEEEENASEGESSSEQHNASVGGVDGDGGILSVGDFLRGTMGKRERRQVGRPRRFD